LVCKLFAGFSSRPFLPTSFVNLRFEGWTGTPVSQKTGAKKRNIFQSTATFMYSFEKLLFLRSPQADNTLYNIISSQR
jgi:hypothetical protein